MTAYQEFGSKMRVFLTLPAAEQVWIKQARADAYSQKVLKYEVMKYKLSINS